MLQPFACADVELHALLAADNSHPNPFREGEGLEQNEEMKPEC